MGGTYILLLNGTSSLLYQACIDFIKSLNNSYIDLTCVKELCKLVKFNVRILRFENMLLFLILEFSDL